MLQKCEHSFIIFCVCVSCFILNKIETWSWLIRSKSMKKTEFEQKMNRNRTEREKKVMMMMMRRWIIPIFIPISTLRLRINRPLNYALDALFLYHFHGNAIGLWQDWPTLGFNRQRRIIHEEFPNWLTLNVYNWQSVWNFHISCCFLHLSMPILCRAVLTWRLRRRPYAKIKIIDKFFCLYWFCLTQIHSSMMKMKHSSV